MLFEEYLHNKVFINKVIIYIYIYIYNLKTITHYWSVRFFKNLFELSLLYSTTLHLFVQKYNKKTVCSEKYFQLKNDVTLKFNMMILMLKKHIIIISVENSCAF